MLIDFHTHTTASDGALSPAALLARAAERGVSLLAITDHDTVDGCVTAQQCLADFPGLRLVSGIELSSQWSGCTVHVVGLGMDCDHPAMRAGLAHIDAARRERGHKIAERLASHGMHGALEGALALAGSSQLGRPHFADWMVQAGYVSDVRTAFHRWLGQGRIGDVKCCWPALVTAVQWVVAAGGIAVLAHPHHYRFTGMKLRRLVADFAAAGGGAIEVCSGRPVPAQVAHLRRLARDFALAVSAGSDFHRDGPYQTPIGVDATQYSDLDGVWARLG